MDRQGIIRKAMEQKLPKAMLELFEGACTDELITARLGYSYAPPEIFYDMPAEVWRHYRADRYHPILVVNGGCIFALDPETRGVTHYYLEGLSATSLPLPTWDGLFVGVVLRWWDAEWSYEELMHISGVFGLKHTQQLLSSVEQSNGFSTFEAMEQWTADMLKQINGSLV